MFPKRGPEGYSEKDWNEINEEKGVKKVIPHYPEGDSVESEMTEEQKIEQLKLEDLINLNIESKKRRLEKTDGMAAAFAEKALEIKRQAS